MPKVEDWARRCRKWRLIIYPEVKLMCLSGLVCLCDDDHWLYDLGGPPSEDTESSDRFRNEGRVNVCMALKYPTLCFDI